MEFVREEQVRKNIEHMNKLEGYNIIIICCSSSLQANYWQNRLNSVKGSIIPVDSIVIAVEEDWPGGAGNALGTLYAYQNALQIAKERDGVDLNELIVNGKSIALYHTAGKGTRLAPLPGAENNNKPGVKLPGTIAVGEKKSPITILEAVIKQTGCYAKSRGGRLSVFWGDQIFIPTVPVEYPVTHHVDILCSLGPMLTEEEWKARGMDKYGLIARNSHHNAAQVEKVDHATAVKLLADLGEIEAVGPSLGSFSISYPMLFTLLNEFSSELAAKKGKLDSDPHLWMPMTLSKSSYIQLMGQKGVNEELAGAHFDRIASMMKKFHDTIAVDYPTLSSLGVFGPVDVGQEVFWWDYGQLKLYQKNTTLLLDNTLEAEFMRMFFGLETKEEGLVYDSTISSEVSVHHSCCHSTHLEHGRVESSVLNHVNCHYIDAQKAILINVTAERIIAKPGSIAYNVVDHSPEGIVLEEGQVRTGVFQGDGNQLVIHSHMTTDGGKSWETSVHGNDYSFEEIHDLNSNVCPQHIENVIADTHSSVWKNIKERSPRKGV